MVAEAAKDFLAHQADVEAGSGKLQQTVEAFLSDRSLLGSRSTFYKHLCKEKSGETSVVQPAGRPTTFDGPQERYLALQAHVHSEMNEPFTRNEWKEYVCCFASLNSIEDFKASDDWMTGFNKRNDLKWKKSIYLAPNRKMALTETLDEWASVWMQQLIRHEEELPKWYKGSYLSFFKLNTR